MNLRVDRTEKLRGEIVVPASKSHTIRAVMIAALAGGTSRLRAPLFSDDTLAAVRACRALGADVEQQPDMLIIRGCGSSPGTPDRAIDCLNSGTTTNLLLGIMAACGVPGEITGDGSLQSRPVSALAHALSSLGCSIEYLKTRGCPPLRLSGRITGGKVTVDASKSSQYVSSLLLACPLAEQDTEITVLNPTELPYIDMTLKWLDDQGIDYERDGYHCFKVRGGQSYKPFEKVIPADWSSATFPICAAAVTGSEIFVRGVDMDDIQGDKAVVDYLGSMGADITAGRDGIRIQGGDLQGRDLDINATPDALPALAVVGCCARGATTLYNVAQARVKETDRITVMAEELQKMGADIKELPDGLLVRKSRLTGARVSGRHDHRVVMALSIAGMAAAGPTTIETAEAVSVTYPAYVESMRAIGVNIMYF